MAPASMSEGAPTVLHASMAFLVPFVLFSIVIVVTASSALSLRIVSTRGLRNSTSKFVTNQTEHILKDLHLMAIRE